MRQIGFSKYEQHLSERVTEALKQMTELEQLRELVRLREAAKVLYRAQGASSQPGPPIDPPSGFKCATS